MFSESGRCVAVQQGVGCLLLVPQGMGWCFAMYHGVMVPHCALGLLEVSWVLDTGVYRCDRAVPGIKLVSACVLGFRQGFGWIVPVELVLSSVLRIGLVFVLFLGIELVISSRSGLWAMSSENI